MVMLGRLLAVVALAAGLAACGGDDEPDGGLASTAADEARDTATEEPLDVAELLAGVIEFDGLSREHARGEIAYEQFPPAGGVHSPEWQTCGLYVTEISPERAVHSLEHGAVWIAHRPDLDVSPLAELVGAESHLLVSPAEGLTAPMVVSAWGAQLEVEGPGDPSLIAFILAYIRNGPESAPCNRGGVGIPPNEPGPPVG